ncbi:hypothetical protein VTI74DRAFT_7539 [Chaetomium olivicolor]
MALEIASLPPPPTISLCTRQMAGLFVDVYGLDELSPAVTNVSCLWLHHPRLRDRGHMAGIAARCVDAWKAQEGRQGSGEEGKGKRGLIALAYDQRNHGSRLVDEKANGAWREGNALHAVDMFGVIEGMVGDQKVLLDLVEGYLFPEGTRKIDQHLALGISLGGHSVWQLMFAEPRVTAGVVVIGCPDYMYLLSDRARLSKLSTYSKDDGGISFLGSRDFPPSLIEACKKFDPKAIFFGTSAVPDVKEGGLLDDTWRQIIRDRVRNKKFLLCSGGDDKLVPYKCSEPFLQWFKPATRSWFREEGVSVDDRVYPGVGHSFSVDMIADSVQFVVDVVAGAGQAASPGSVDEQRASKI